MLTTESLLRIQIPIHAVLSVADASFLHPFFTLFFRFSSPSKSCNSSTYGEIQTVYEADSFLDTSCMMFHYWGAYAPYRDQLLDRVLDLGFRIVRDAMLLPEQVTITLSHLKSYNLSIMLTAATCNDCNLTTTTQWLDAIAASIVVNHTLVDSLEGINEPGNTTVYNFTKYPECVEMFMKDFYTTAKSNEILKNIPILAPPWPITHDNPYPTGSLAKYCDFGNYHPYPIGNCLAPKFYYEGFTNWTGYFCDSHSPTCAVDKNYSGNDFVNNYLLPFAPNPPAISEWGYTQQPNETSDRAFSGYAPRLLLEGFRLGNKRNCLYELWNQGPEDNDNMEDHFGLIFHNFTAKPAYFAVKNLLHLLADPGPAFSPKPLDITVQVTEVDGYFRTDFVHWLVFQKRSGDYIFVYWHEIALENAFARPYIPAYPPSLPINIRMGRGRKYYVITHASPFVSAIQVTPDVSNVGVH